MKSLMPLGIGGCTVTRRMGVPSWRCYTRDVSGRNVSEPEFYEAALMASNRLTYTDGTVRKASGGMALIDDLSPIHGSKYRLQERLSVQERLEQGKQLRQQLKRRRQDYAPAENRPDPVDILAAQAKTRVPSLVPLRYARMLTSPFAFLRGAAAVMIQDIAPMPTTGITVQACGDMHVANFGVYASAERTLVFGINDFDETYPAPWEWDLKRLVASGVVAARYLGAIAP